MVEKTIDLNCDLGESFGAYQIGLDAEVMEYITSANIACGWHAGDPVVMDKTVSLAVDRHINCGAHPGFPDLQGFGRRFIECSPNEIRNFLIYQIGALQAFCAVNGVQLSHVKPHGALYNAAVHDESIGRTTAEAIAAVNPNLFYFTLAGKAGETLSRIGQESGLRVIREAFPDRAYTSIGTLVPRKQKNAVIDDPKRVADRALQIASKGMIQSEDGNWIELHAQTLCVHGDTAHAVELVKNIRKVLETNGVVVSPVGD